MLNVVLCSVMGIRIHNYTCVGGVCVYMNLYGNSLCACRELDEGTRMLDPDESVAGNVPIVAPAVSIICKTYLYCNAILAFKDFILLDAI